MDKITYLAELAEGLARWVPERDRQDILRYYAEYFEEAGPGREGEVVAELGDPWALSCRLAVEGGFVTQEAANGWTPPRKKKWSWALAVGITAAVLVFTIGLVASAAAWIGRMVGRAVGDTPVRQATVVDNGEYAYSFADEVIPGVVIYGVEEDTAGGFWTMEDGLLEQFDAIDVEVGLANVTVTAADDYTLFIDQSAKVSGYELTWEVKGGTLKIRDKGSSHFDINSWGELGDLFEGGQWKVDVFITVPETLLDQVSIKTGTGSVYVAAVYAKKIEAETGLGNVECYGPHQVEKLDLESGTGNVWLGMEELCDGLDIDLESGIGNIEASLGCYEQDCAYELESGLGTVSVNGEGQGREAQRKGKASYKLDAESGTGSVDVYFYDSRWQ